MSEVCLNATEIATQSSRGLTHAVLVKATTPARLSQPQQQMRHGALQLCSLPCLLLLQAPPGEADGLLLSPFSLAQALAMLANGAEPGGESYKQVLVGLREGAQGVGPRTCCVRLGPLRCLLLLHLLHPTFARAACTLLHLTRSWRAQLAGPRAGLPASLHPCFTPAPSRLRLPAGCPGSLWHRP